MRRGDIAAMIGPAPVDRLPRNQRRSSKLASKASGAGAFRLQSTLAVEKKKAAATRDAGAADRPS